MLGSHYIMDLVKEFAGWHRVPDKNRYWDLYGYFSINILYSCIANILETLFLSDF